MKKSRIWTRLRQYSRGMLIHFLSGSSCWHSACTKRDTTFQYSSAHFKHQYGLTNNKLSVSSHKCTHKKCINVKTKFITLLHISVLSIQNCLQCTSQFYSGTFKLTFRPMTIKQKKVVCVHPTFYLTAEHITQ
jgi:hypothetical protein